MKRVMKIIDEENNEGEYEIICHFDSELTNKSYVVYTGYYEDEDGKILMHAGSYVEDGDVLRVNTKITHEENEMITDVVNSIIDQFKKFKK